VIDRPAISSEHAVVLSWVARRLLTFFSSH
jgi:hypothetical protein